MHAVALHAKQDSILIAARPRHPECRIPFPFDGAQCPRCALPRAHAHRDFPQRVFFRQCPQRRVGGEAPVDRIRTGREVRRDCRQSVALGVVDRTRLRRGTESEEYDRESTGHSESRRAEPESG